MYALAARWRTARSSRAGGPAAAAPEARAGDALVLHAADGQPLAATWHAAGDTPRGVLVIAPATGVPQGFYRRFAAWAAGQGLSVLSFDYRGIGRSRPRRLRGFTADFSHWALDIDAALAHALAQGLPVSLIGHSIGGFLGPIAEHATRLNRLVLVGAQTAYWRDWPARRRLAMAALWHGLMPALTLAAGFFPGRALRLGEDLPRGVALQWAMRPWRDPFTVLGLARYARPLPPVHFVAADDDDFATGPAQARVQRRLAACEVQCHRIAPASLGLRGIGHFGLFRQPAAAAWPQLLGLAFPSSDDR